MHRFELTPELATGNPDIDSHHQTLFAMANEILFSDELAKSQHLFRRAVTFLVSYLEYHFASEELAMFQGCTTAGDSTPPSTTTYGAKRPTSPNG